MNPLLEDFLASVQASATGDTIGFKETKRYWRIIKNIAGHDLMAVLGEQAACPGAAGANFQDPAGAPIS